MKTELVQLNSMLLGGVSFYGDPFRQKGGWDSDNEIGKTCMRYAEFISENPERPYSANKPYFYEIHIYSRETADKGYFEVFAGEEVTTPELPVYLCTKFISASNYLKVTLTGTEITQDWWKKLDDEILPKYGVKRNDGFILQAYDERFKGMEQIEASEIDAYIPVEKA